jgi:hypothetical protein
MPLRTAVLALLLLAVATPAAPAAPSVPRSAAKAVLDACERGSGELDRAAVFEGQMRSLRRSSRMQMRFTLQARTPDTMRWSAVAAPGFGSWVSSAPGTSRYVYTKRVEGLLAPAHYRVRLRFRWLDGAGRVIASARRASRACRQPDPRPNLVVSSLAVRPVARPGRARYVAFVRNTGRSTADPTELRFAFDDLAPRFAPVLALQPGEGVEVSVEGPMCTEGEPVDADADAGEAVDERDETDNRFTRLCPPPA